MEKSMQLANRLREVILNGTWIANTNYKDQLEKIDWQIANKKTGTLNSISAIAQHVHYYLAGVLNVFVKDKLEIKDEYSFDFPEIQSVTDWEKFLTKFWVDTELLAVQIEMMSEQQLEEIFVDEKYDTYLRNIDGMIEHSYYHLGQIVLLNKLLS